MENLLHGSKMNVRIRCGSTVFLGGGLLLLVLSIAVAGAKGTVTIPIPDVIRIIINALPIVSINETWNHTDETILLQLRLPRVIAAALVGSALSTAGVLFQGIFRNPLVDPFIIGASSGAAFAAVLGFLIIPQVGFVIYGFSWVPILAFIGSVSTVVLVYLISRSQSRVQVTTLLLAGVAVGAFLTAVMSFILLTQTDSQFRLGAVLSWLMGGVGTVGWAQFLLLGPFVAIGVFMARLLAKPLNAFSLGEEHAQTLGIGVERNKIAILTASSLLTAAAVAAAGLVGFVGLITPHIMRLIIGPDHRTLIWASVIYGATFVVLADLAARTLLTPQEIPLGVITGVIGGPFFLILLRRSKNRLIF